jgi:hypothetical protein
MKWTIVSLALIIAGALCGSSSALPPPQPKPLSPIAQAAKTLSDAKIALAKVKVQLEPLRRRAATVFEVRPDWKAAKENLEQAKAAYDTESKNSLLKAHNSAAYKALLVKRDKAQAIVESSVKKDTPSSDENAAKLTDEDVANAQKDRIEAALALKKMDKDALDGNPAYASAKQNYKEAQSAWDALQSQLDDAVKLDPAYPPIGQQVDAAEAAVKQAQASYDSAVKQASTPRPAPPPRR